MIFSAAFGAMLLIGVTCSWGSASRSGGASRASMRRRRRSSTAISAAGSIATTRRTSSTSSPKRSTACSIASAVCSTICRQVTTDIAHDLRTPLARQKQILEGGARHGSRCGCLSPCHPARADRARILSIFTAMLRISSGDLSGSRSIPAGRSRRRSAERVADASSPERRDDRARNHARSRCGHDRRGRSPSARADVREPGRERTAAHAASGTRIAISIRRWAGATLLVIADTGAGVHARGSSPGPARRFVRLSAADQRRGMASGLSPAAAIARAHFATTRIVGRRAPACGSSSPSMAAEPPRGGPFFGGRRTPSQAKIAARSAGAMPSLRWRSST